MHCISYVASMRTKLFCVLTTTEYRANLFSGVLCWSLFWYALLYVLSSVAIILKGKRELVALLLLSFGCLVTVNVLWLFLKVRWVGLQCVNVAFPEHNHLLLCVSPRCSSVSRNCFLT